MTRRPYLPDSVALRPGPFAHGLVVQMRPGITAKDICRAARGLLQEGARQDALAPVIVIAYPGDDSSIPQEILDLVWDVETTRADFIFRLAADAAAADAEMELLQTPVVSGGGEAGQS